MIANAVDLKPRDLVISFGDLHIYKNHLDQVEEQLSREPRELPAVYVDDRLRGKGLSGLLECTWDDIKLHRYNPHPKIAAEVAV